MLRRRPYLLKMIKDQASRHLGIEVGRFPGHAVAAIGDGFYHPGFYRTYDKSQLVFLFEDTVDGFQGIEIENALHNWHIDREKVKEIAAAHNLVLLSNSDAHYLRDVGMCYTELLLDDLYQQA